MPETNQSGGTATAVDMDALAKLIKTTTAEVVGEAVKPLNARIEELQKATPQAKDGKADAVKTLTEAEIDARIAAGVEAKLKAQQTTAAAEKTRADYAADKLKDLPEVYRNQLGNDPAKFAEQEQKIRDTFKADFAAAGGRAKDIGGIPPAAANGAPPAAGVNLDKNSAQQNIAAGIAAAK